MTLQVLAPSLFVPLVEGRTRSLWRRLFNAIMEGRQRKADDCVADYLRHRRREHHENLRSALERRLLNR